MRIRELFWFLLLATALCARRPAGQLRIEVRDPSGAPMEASGKVESITGDAKRQFQVDAQGVVTIEDLPYVRYLLQISRKGFATYSALIDISAPATSRVVNMTLGNAAFTVDVVSATPLPGVELARDEVPSPVQAAGEREIEQSGALDLPDFLNRRLSGVHVNEFQGNPFQPDVNYRGYTASPLLGTPQGLSVYMDGVRLNQPFGDVVSWDLIPKVAISETTLIPGSNPVFGLNTLGGAISILTKNGSSQPSPELTITGGSFGRKAAEFEYGGATIKGLDWYLGSNLFFEDGWREASTSNVRQFIGKLGWQRSNTMLGLAVVYVNNALTGNGLQEPRLLARDYSGIYTKPDITANRSPFFNLSARQALNNAVTFSGNLYYRYIRTNTLNGDLNENSLDQSVYQPNAAERAALAAAGYTGVPVSGENASNTPFPFWRCLGQVLLRDEPAEKCNGLLNRTHTAQHNYGGSGQITWLASSASRRNQLTAGAGWDGSRVDFQQTSELGYLNPDRSIHGVQAFADGVTGGSLDGEPFDRRVNLSGRIHTGSLFATDTLSLGARWSVTVSGRYNRTVLDNRDRITPGGGAGSLDSHNVVDRLNPAFGVTFSPVRLLNAYAAYNEGSRAPTSIELGCADPNQPCKLPNALLGDPPLKQVVARTIEAGFRGGEERSVRWSLGWFRAENRNDVLFVASSQTGFGYFKNFGKTQRQGIEADLNSRIWRFNLGGGYTFLDATYQSPETVQGSGNSYNDTAARAKGFDGSIRIEPGDRIPLLPRHTLKAFADLRATSKLSVDLGLVATSSSFARGNENNQHKADGVYYLGPGTSPGYVLVNLGARYQVNRRVQLFVQVNNLLDRHYYTGAQLGPTGITGQGTFLARPFPATGNEFPVLHDTFFAPGAPRGAWAGMRFRF